MKRTNTLILFALVTILISSCTMEKRLYNKGFHVSWNKKYKVNKKQKTESVAFAELEEDAEMEVNKVPLQSIEMVEATEQDRADFVEIEAEQMAFETETSFEAPNEIVVATASREESEPIEQMNVVASKQSARKKGKQSSHDSDSSSSDRSQVVALVLVILLGVLGVHRFYLGYTGIGILMLFTAGLFGILALIDLIRIAVGDLKPKHGEYSEKL